MKHIVINNVGLFAFDLNYVTFSDFKLVILAHTPYIPVSSKELVVPYVLHIFDCNKMCISDIHYSVGLDYSSIKDIKSFNDGVRFL
jgi:hypothetical protein